MPVTATATRSFETSLSESWLDYYRDNRESLLQIPWEQGAEISESEYVAIWESVREFQLGESSEGRHILHCAREYAAHRRTPAYAETIELFVREEQRHARDLGRFMDLAGLCVSATAPARRTRNLYLRADHGGDHSQGLLRRVATSDRFVRPAPDLRSSFARRTRACALPLRLPGDPPERTPAGALRCDRGRPAIPVLRYLPCCLEIPQPGNQKRWDGIRKVLEGLLAGDERGDAPRPGRP